MVDSDKGCLGNDVLTRLSPDISAGRRFAELQAIDRERKQPEVRVVQPVTARRAGAASQPVRDLRNRLHCHLEVHNPGTFENAFRCRTITLTGAPLFVDYARSLAGDNLCVVSPDTGGAKWAELFREALEAACGQPVGKAFVDKHRSAGVVSGDLFVGDVAALVVDDLISTGGTLLRAARAIRKAGAKRVIALVTHRLFMLGSAEVLADPAIDRLVVTDTVPPFRFGTDALRDKLTILPSAPLFADAIRRLHQGRSLADLLVF